MPALTQDIGAPWLNTMLELAGQGIKEYPGGDDNPIILGFARHVGLAFPEQADYANLYKHDATAWCGVTVAEALARNGIAPPFGPRDIDKWMWADSYSREFFADKLDEPRRGAIIVFNWRNGGGHVGVVDAWDAVNRTVDVVGGNQNNAVTRARFHWDGQVKGFYWPKKLAAAQASNRTPADVRRRMGAAITLAEARLDKNGHVAVYPLPPGDGGGSYEVAGINDRYHPVMAAKLRRMIEVDHAPDQEVRDAIGDYTGSFTDAADVWTSSWAVEFYLRDSIFHRGPTGAVIIMQIALKSLGENLGPSGNFRDGIDGDFGPLTSEAMRRQEQNPEQLLGALRAAREFYERNGSSYISGGPHRDESSKFWKGLVNRWNNQLVVARRFDAEQPKDGTMPTADQPQIPVPPPTSTGPSSPTLPDMTSVGIDPKKFQEVMQIAQVAMVVIAMMRGQQIQVPMPTLPAPEPPPPPPPVVQPAPAAPARSSGRTDLFAQILGLLGAGGAAVGASTGMIEPSTAMTVATSSLIPLVGGILGLFNPTLGAAISGIGGLLHRVTAPAQNPPTR